MDKKTRKVALDVELGLVDDGLVTVVDPPGEDVSAIIARNAHLFTGSNRRSEPAGVELFARKAEPPSMGRPNPSLTRLLAGLDPDPGDSEVATIPRRAPLPIRSPGLPRPPNRRPGQPVGGNVHELPTMMLNVGPPPMAPKVQQRVVDIDTLLTIPAPPRPNLGRPSERASIWSRLRAWLARLWTRNEPVGRSAATIERNEQAVSGAGRPQLAGAVPVHVRAR
ncbi:MAG: hypothetical protein KJO07_11255 [Deltaproteobacteria bacterium]|nr:hypothetical protein [Deltaproteobacteria bacterium]